MLSDKKYLSRINTGLSSFKISWWVLKDARVLKQSA